MHYRIYVLDYRLQILEGHDFVARNDLTALDRGMSFSAANPVEIWERRRLVARIGMEAVLERPIAFPGDIDQAA